MVRKCQRRAFLLFRNLVEFRAKYFSHKKKKKMKEIYDKSYRKQYKNTNKY